MDVWPSSQNFCWWHVSSVLYSDWYSSFPHGRHLVSWVSVQDADRYVPVYSRKTAFICLVEITHLVLALLKVEQSHWVVFMKQRLNWGFYSFYTGAGLGGYVGVPLSPPTHFPFKTLFKSIQALLYTIFVFLEQTVLEDYFGLEDYYLVCTCYSITCLSRGIAFGCMLV